MLVKKAQVVPIECVARGYLAGSGWKEYQKTRSVCGVALPAGVQPSDKLPNPIFTPATKETPGHHVNVSLEDAAQRVRRHTATQVREETPTPYSIASPCA